MQELKSFGKMESFTPIHPLTLKQRVNKLKK